MATKSNPFPPKKVQSPFPTQSFGQKPQPKRGPTPMPQAKCPKCKMPLGQCKC